MKTKWRWVGDNHDSIPLKAHHLFNQKKLQQQALTHRSAGADNNERLEFLGDAIVNFIIAEAISRQFPDAPEGQLSRLRAELVKQESLADIARQLSLGEQLILGAGEMKSGARHRDSILSDAFEALVAAIYLDSDMDKCKLTVLSWFAEKLAGLSLVDEYKDAKTSLQEWLQARNMPLPSYQLLEESGPDNQRIFRMRCRVDMLQQEAEADGISKKQAEFKAAEQLLDQLKKIKK